MANDFGTTYSAEAQVTRLPSLLRDCSSPAATMETCMLSEKCVGTKALTMLNFDATDTTIVLVLAFARSGEPTHQPGDENGDVKLTSDRLQPSQRLGNPALRSNVSISQCRHRHEAVVNRL